MKQALTMYNKFKKVLELLNISSNNNILTKFMLFPMTLRYGHRSTG